METFIITDEGNIITIHGTVTRGQRGMRDNWGVQETPDDMDEYEIIEAYDSDSNDVELTKEQEEEAIEALIEALS